MSHPRVIARLDIKGPNLVKGVHLEGLRVMGKPEQFARHYYAAGVDELLYMDVVASLYGRNGLLDIIEKTSKEIFIPLIVGGGIRSLDDIRKILCAGADKVTLNTAAVKRPELISEAANKFGSSTIVVSIEALKKPDGSYEAYTDNGREHTGFDVYEWAIRAAKLGAGEIIITSIDREGTGTGYDLELTRRISESVSIPVVACGGAGQLSHIADVFEKAKADAACIASLFHYHMVNNNAIEGDFSSEGNLHFLNDKKISNRTFGATVAQVKQYLINHGLDCRPAQSEAAHV